MTVDWDSDPELRALHAEFVASFETRKRAIRALIDEFRRKLASTSPVATVSCEGPAHELRVLAHNLAGAAPTYGFEELGKTASVIDNRLSDERESESLEELLQDAIRLEGAIAQALISCAGSPASGAKP